MRSLTGKLWPVYIARNKTRFRKRMCHLRQWNKENVTSTRLRKKVIKVCRNTSKFIVAYSFPEGYRTGNEVERLMNCQDRWPYSM